jgi:predicted N-acetyltransferase YhbS
MEEAARIGLVIVAPDAQGRGIGRTLMERVIDDAGQRPMMLLATDAGRPLYASLGFESVGLNQRHLGEYRGEPTAADGVEPLTPGDVAAVLELDARAMGVVRRDIVEHLVEVGDGAVLRVDGHLAGYAIRRPFGGGDVVGPIVAPSDDEAVALFRAVARPGLVRVDRSVEAERLGAFLEDSDVTGHEVTHVMERGTWPQVDTSVRSHAMASHAWG